MGPLDFLHGIFCNFCHGRDGASFIHDEANPEGRVSIHAGFIHKLHHATHSTEILPRALGRDHSHGGHREGSPDGRPFTWGTVDYHGTFGSGSIHHIQDFLPIMRLGGRDGPGTFGPVKGIPLRVRVNQMGLEPLGHVGG
jgi:hypothetical protein